MVKSRRRNSRSRRKPCKSNQVRNRSTGRCRKVSRRKSRSRVRVCPENIRVHVNMDVVRMGIVKRNLEHVVSPEVSPEVSPGVLANLVRHVVVKLGDAQVSGVEAKRL